MKWETVIGLETHVELSTATKIFCGCTTAFGGAPNTHCCPICTGLPGALPALNQTVLEYAVLTGLALSCDIARLCRFDRKHYVYPDLPKAYQVSQYYLPIGRNGFMELRDGQRIGIHELHMEEDAGKLTHRAVTGKTAIDYNRCGVPLIEIVTEPDFRSAEAVVDYLERLKTMLQYLGVSDCKLEEGSLRCDVNLSVRPAGSEAPGVRTELKNLGSFRAIARGVDAESARQIALLERGEAVVQETRRWDEGKNESFPMRAKAAAGDYRYVPEPDLPPIHLSEAWLEERKQAIPELPEEKRRRYQAQFGLSAYDAQTVTARRELARFFEETVRLGAAPKEAANWMMGHLLRKLSECGKDIKDICFTPKTLARLIERVGHGALNRGTAAAVFDAVFETDGDVDEYLRTHALGQISDAQVVERAVADVLQENPVSLVDYCAGKEKALGFLMGQAMRRLGGRGDPALVREVLLCDINRTKETKETCL